jgi:bifunctional non-homologous end joining protein LigD
MARRDPVGIRLLTRNGHDWAERYPAIMAAVNRLKVCSCLIDAEAVVCDEHGLAVFERLRRKHEGTRVFLYAFDLLELDGQDLRREPFETRKATLTSLLRGSLPGLLNEHLVQPGELVFRHACKLGLEGIVSKRLGSPYRSGRSPDWLKFKNPAAPAVKREAEEDWGQQSRQSSSRSLDCVWDCCLLRSSCRSDCSNSWTKSPCASGDVLPTAPAARPTGSSSRTPAVKREAEQDWGKKGR